jgi:cytochrome c biogenesis protein
LSYAGFTFYQSSFRPVVSEKIVELAISNPENNILKRYKIRLNSEIILNSGVKIIAQKIYDDFAGLGEALRIGQVEPDGQSTFFHIFRKYPDYDKLVRSGSNYILFLGTDQKYATGLSIGKVPGIKILFSGFLLFLVGCFMCFFMTPVRYFAHVDGLKIIFAAQSFRDAESVKQEFNKKLQVRT